MDGDKIHGDDSGMTMAHMFALNTSSDGKELIFSARNHGRQVNNFAVRY